MRPEIRVRLLGSIQAGRLVIVCGAGLSMAPPSNLPPAWRVAEASFERYRTTVDPECDVAMRHDLEAFAQHFADQRTLQSVFIESLVPWADFVRPPNAGHAAIADFLVTRAAAAALSGNYDMLIERCAIENRFDFQSSLDGEEATVRMRTQSPLLKFHGCATRDRPSTLWTASQLSQTPVAERIAKSKEWIAANLRQKDLLVVGFWSDWAYLNGALGKIFDGFAPLSVTVIDMANAAVLEAKAPGLWALAHCDHVSFAHVQELRGRGAGRTAEGILGELSQGGIGGWAPGIRGICRRPMPARLVGDPRLQFRSPLRSASRRRRRSSRQARYAVEPGRMRSSRGLPSDAATGRCSGNPRRLRATQSVDPSCKRRRFRPQQA